MELVYLLYTYARQRLLWTVICFCKQSSGYANLLFFVVLGVVMLSFHKGTWIWEALTSMQPLCLFYTSVNSCSATWNCHPIVNKMVVGLWWTKSVGGNWNSFGGGGWSGVAGARPQDEPGWVWHAGMIDSFFLSFFLICLRCIT